MAFAEAVSRLLVKKVCLNCYARNPMNADKCRRCGCTQLRVKAKEPRGGAK